MLSLDNKVPFDFLVDGEFLRTSLKQWRKQQASERSVVTIEYVKALVAPQEHHDSLHLDWVKCIASRNGLSVSGSFDSSLRVFESSKQYKESFVLQSTLLNNQAIWDVAWINDSNLVCGGKSCSAQVLEWTGKELLVRQVFSIGSSVASLDARNDPERIVCGSTAGGLYFFDIDLQFAKSDDFGEMEGEEQSRNKKQRLLEDVSAPALSLAGHRQSVVACCWNESDKLMTASLDRSAKLWDIGSGEKFSFSSLLSFRLFLFFSSLFFSLCLSPPSFE